MPSGELLRVDVPAPYSTMRTSGPIRRLSPNAGFFDDTTFLDSGNKALAQLSLKLVRRFDDKPRAVVQPIGFKVRVHAGKRFMFHSELTNVLMPSPILPGSVLPSVWIIKPQWPTRVPPQAISTVSVSLKMISDGSSLPNELEPTRTFHCGLCSCSFQSDHLFGPGRRSWGGNVSLHNPQLIEVRRETRLT